MLPLVSLMFYISVAWNVCLIPQDKTSVIRSSVPKLFVYMFRYFQNISRQLKCFRIGVYSEICDRRRDLPSFQALVVIFILLNFGDEKFACIWFPIFK